MRLAVIALVLCLGQSVRAEESKPALPSWFPAPSGYTVRDFTYHAYDEFNLFADNHKVEWVKRNSGGYAPIHGKVWRFNMDHPSPEAWTAVGEALLKQGFTFVHGDMRSIKSSAALMKGEGEQAVFVAFWQCCNSVAIVEPGPNPFHLTLTPPAAKREALSDGADVPYLSPIAGGKLTAGHTLHSELHVRPACDAKSEPFGTEYTERDYVGPDGLSDYAIQQTFEAARSCPA